ncbi:GATA zinc finger domain-containing protein 4-like [Monomorium pharaonis]|uniref:GATA zinc finger domain-containing protein 4-like n=1 Tax=Monomorium pharaonis TaxID=307658 RepID=UPI0017479A3C|nr:GATA zinc finger domain-containing protein 4-like [Monomorium pharaonis]
MSLFNNNAYNNFLPYRKRYRLWKQSVDVPVPLKTRRRWRNNITAENIYDNERMNDISNNAEENSNSNSNSFINSNDAEDFDVKRENTNILITNLNHCHEKTINVNNNSNNFDIIHNESEANTINIDNKNDDQLNDENNFEILQENSCDEIIVNILELYVRHKWTKSSLQDNLLLLRKVASNKTQIPSTIYKLFQYVKDRVPKFTTTKHFSCTNCLNYNGIKINSNCLL